MSLLILKDVDFPEGTKRGGHAHHQCHQFLISMVGRFEVTLDDGKTKQILILKEPNQGLYVPPGIWVDILSLNKISIFVVLASHPYDEADYIRNYESFLKP